MPGTLPDMLSPPPRSRADLVEQIEPKSSAPSWVAGRRIGLAGRNDDGRTASAVRECRSPRAGAEERRGGRSEDAPAMPTAKSGPAHDRLQLSGRRRSMTGPDRESAGRGRRPRRSRRRRALARICSSWSVLATACFPAGRPRPTTGPVSAVEFSTDAPEMLLPPREHRSTSPTIFDGATAGRSLIDRPAGRLAEWSVTAWSMATLCWLALRRRRCTDAASSSISTWIDLGADLARLFSHRARCLDAGRHRRGYSGRSPSTSAIVADSPLRVAGGRRLVSWEQMRRQGSPLRIGHKTPSPYGSQPITWG